MQKAMKVLVKGRPSNVVVKLSTKKPVRNLEARKHIVILINFSRFVTIHLHHSRQTDIYDRQHIIK